jgi:hypothetical protein
VTQPSLFPTNVEGLRHLLDAAADADLRRFVFTSTIEHDRAQRCFISAHELHGTAAEAGGNAAAPVGIPLTLMYALGFGGDIAATVLRCYMLLATLSVRLMHIMSLMDHARPSGNSVGIPSRSTTRFGAQWRSTERTSTLASLRVVGESTLRCSQLLIAGAAHQCPC